jgi:microcystin-dependent protein
VNNMQSSLAVNYAVVANNGIFPGNGGSGTTTMPILAQIKAYAGNALPDGQTSADGQLINFTSNIALFSLLGTTYGGDSQPFFARPDLRGRAAIGAGQGPGLASHDIGETLGAESVLLTQTELPIHSHTLPAGGSTGAAGFGQSLDNMQPSLALQYIIATQGIFGGTDGEFPFLGEITLFAGNFVPDGWALCNGQTFNIATNTALFALLGDTYGGDGIQTFALPDLRGRVPVGAGGSLLLGVKGGAEEKTISLAEMAAHDHDFVAVPEPSTFGLAGLGAVMLGLIARRRRSV